MESGDSGDELASQVYGELRQLAQGFLRRERSDHTLQPTALVHEAYLRLAGREDVVGLDRSRFLCAAAAAMRRILVNHARDRSRLKRGGGRARVDLGTDVIALTDEDCARHLDLDRALEALREHDPRKSQVVEMRHFGGCSREEIAAALGVSVETVKRDWAFARAWLGQYLGTSAS